MTADAGAQACDFQDEPAIGTILSQGLTLRYSDWGNPGAPPVLLIHGSRDHARSWDWTARALRDRWHVVALDLRGHGNSDWSADGAYLLPYHLLDMIAMVEALGVQPVTIVAHSFGGIVAARYAGLFPTRVWRLVLVDSLGPDPATRAHWSDVGPVERTRQWAVQRRARESQRSYGSVDEAVLRIIKANPRLSPSQAHHLTVHALKAGPHGLNWKFDPRASMFTPEDFDLDERFYWREITAPTLIMHGQNSWKSDPTIDGRAAIFPNHRVLTFADAGHWIHHDQLARFVTASEDFLGDPAVDGPPVVF